MGIEKIGRWVWVLIGAALGLVADQVQRMPKGSWTSEYGQGLSQIEFENGIKPRGSGGRPFKNLVVYPEQITDAGGKGRNVHIVSGDYSGRYGMLNGKYGPVTDRKAFVAEIPYRTIAQLADNKPGAEDVMAYLDGLKKSDPEIGFRYVWWREAKWSRSFWVGSGVLVIGLIWPTVINLLTYGSLFRPREAKGTDLSKVSSATAPVVSIASQADLDKAAALAAEIEKNLAAQASGAAAVAVDVPTPVKQLDNTPLPEMAPTNAPHSEFGQKDDDFYPTERHHPHTSDQGHKDSGHS